MGLHGLNWRAAGCERPSVVHPLLQIVGARACCTAGGSSSARELHAEDAVDYMCEVHGVNVVSIVRWVPTACAFAYKK